MPGQLPPLSPAVSSIFDEFVKKLENEKVLEAAALSALKLSLAQQKLDPASLREAMFTQSEPKK